MSVQQSYMRPFNGLFLTVPSVYTCACAASYGLRARNIAFDDDVCEQQRVLRQHPGVAESSAVLVRQRANFRKHSDHVRVSLYACADCYGDDVSPSKYRVSTSFAAGTVAAVGLD